MENPDLPGEDRDARRSIQRHNRHLELIWQKLIELNDAIRRTRATIDDFVALMRRIGDEGK